MPMYDRSTFGPFELDLMAAAFDAALTTVADETSSPPDIHPHVLRQRIAAGIVAAAQVGVIDVEDLATEGLRALTSRNP